jgi:hypothetical protein
VGIDKPRQECLAGSINDFRGSVRYVRTNIPNSATLNQHVGVWDHLHAVEHTDMLKEDRSFLAVRANGKYQKRERYYDCLHQALLTGFT